MAGAIDEECNLHLVHGSHVRPTFELLEFNSLEKLTCLVRKVNPEPTKVKVGVKYLTPDAAKGGVTVLAPGSAAMSGRVTSTSGGNKRKTSTSENVEELPMLERYDQLDIKSLL